MTTQIINLSLPQDLVKKIDKAASSQYAASRSEYIRQAVVGRLRNEQDDAWDDLVTLSEGLNSKATQAGLIKDEDFVRSVKEVRANKKR